MFLDPKKPDDIARSDEETEPSDRFISKDGDFEIEFTPASDLDDVESSEEDSD